MKTLKDLNDFSRMNAMATGAPRNHQKIRGLGRLVRPWLLVSVWFVGLSLSRPLLRGMSGELCPKRATSPACCFAITARVPSTFRLALACQSSSPIRVRSDAKGSNAPSPATHRQAPLYRPTADRGQRSCHFALISRITSSGRSVYTKKICTALFPRTCILNPA